MIHHRKKKPTPKLFGSFGVWNSLNIWRVVFTFHGDDVAYCTVLTVLLPVGMVDPRHKSWSIDGFSSNSIYNRQQ